ncbi:MAG: GNAT family N-acetyltransferase [Bacteroidales bacterium]|nr:GNAT family N-acetyltransferase [Bacteroidales bacterium]MDY0141238.1 GNAT family N-acetyltransferase [Bacteroidales bacterium]
MEIKIREDETKGFAIATVNGEIAGKITYTIPSADFIIIDHTEVEPSFKGKGVGKQLLYKIVEMTREKNIKIIPLCPFANSMFQKLTDIQEVLKKQ